MAGKVEIAEVRIEMLLSDGTYVASLLNINGADELSLVESVVGLSIPGALRGLVEEIESKARREFRRPVRPE